MNILVAEPLSTTALSARPLVRIVIVGHVDHGKSTLIGRLLHETGSLPDGKLENLKAISARRGMPFEWSFLLDALQTERDQGITIDTSQIRFRTPSRDIVLIDAPGHTEFLRNMITGAAQADAALLIIDAAEGVRDQTRRHGYLLNLLGVRQVAVVINKMDRVGFDAARFRAIETEITAHFAEVGLPVPVVIPISARNGDGVARHTEAIAWHAGPTVLQALDNFSPARTPDALDLRIPVQAVYKFDDRRIVAGRVETGTIAVGDELAIMPSGKRARVRSIEAWPVPHERDKPQSAHTGQSIGITLDREIFVARGDILSHADTPPAAVKQLRARVFWLHEEPIRPGLGLTVRVGSAETSGTVTRVTSAIDPGRLDAVAGRSIGQNHVGEIELALTKPLAIDHHSVNPRTGRVVLDMQGRIAGGGLILADEPRSMPDAARAGDLAAEAARLNALLTDLTPEERIARFRAEVEGRIVFTTSFGLEDQVITHLLRDLANDIALVTLDTGRQFPESYDLWAETEQRYGVRVRAFYPDHAALEALVAAQGINGFYDSREARTACCHVRKVVPLNRALEGARGWITGLRGDQSAHRQDMQIVTADAARGLLKLNPLFDRTRDQVLDFAAANDVPLNPLHAKGFASIGCAPCTRAIAPGEPERAGRWWWEDEGKKECGLHLSHPARAGAASSGQ